MYRRGSEGPRLVRPACRRYMNGGFDVYAGFPLYLALRNARIEVHLGNLSFASLDLLGVEWEADGLARVTAEAPEVRAYLELVEFAEAATPRRASIVSGSIASAIDWPSARGNRRCETVALSASDNRPRTACCSSPSRWCCCCSPWRATGPSSIRSGRSPWPW